MLSPAPPSDSKNTQKGNGMSFDADIKYININFMKKTPDETQLHQMAYFVECILFMDKMMDELKVSLEA